MLRVQVISREIIKPSCPTPPHLRTYKLTIIDQLHHLVYIPFIFFYNNEEEKGPNTSTVRMIDEKIQKLKQSLSETLTLYYPVAGKIQEDGTTVECNDEGVEFCKARVEGSLSEFLQKPYMEVLDQLVPCSTYSPKSGTKRGAVAVQVNVFDCGGIALGVCLLHRVLDTASLVQFMNSWASTSRSGREAERPLFHESKIFPTEGSFLGFPASPKRNIVGRRFVFDAAKIDLLRARPSLDSAAARPSRVVAVSALIWKCLMSVFNEQQGGKRVCFVSQAVNLRRKTSPPLPEALFGNVVTVGTTTVTEEEWQHQQHDVQGWLEGKMRDAIRGVDEDLTKQLQQPDGLAKLTECWYSSIGKYDVSSLDAILFTSWCGFRFYDVDFGWGKPVWVSTCTVDFLNMVILMNSREGDRIEAWVNLEDVHMAALEHNQELLRFVSPASIE